jgi:hypothetical protein
MNPLVQCRPDPFRHGNRSNVPTLANEIHYGPMFFALLQMREIQIGQLAAPEHTPKQDGQDCAVSFAFQRLRIRSLPKAAGLVRREPIPKPHAQLFDSHHSSDTRGEFRAEQASIGSFIS